MGLPGAVEMAQFLERFILPPPSGHADRVKTTRSGTQPGERYHIIHENPRPLLSLALLVPQARGQTLPELGDTSGALLSPTSSADREQADGKSACASRVFSRSGAHRVLNEIGRRIVAASSGARQDFEFFMCATIPSTLLRCPGDSWVHTGLLLAAQTESELAGVCPQVAHVTQHHLARLLGKQEQMSIPHLRRWFSAPGCTRPPRPGSGGHRRCGSDRYSIAAQLHP